jgi:hypothetical protein
LNGSRSAWPWEHNPDIHNGILRLSSLNLLIVRHGPSRGRNPDYWQTFFDYLERARPDIFCRIRFAETGGPQPSLDGIGAVLFLLGDPLRELYPHCYEEAVKIREHAATKGISVYHDPDVISGFTRESQFHAWKEASIPTPWVRPFSEINELCDILCKVEPPFLLRAPYGRSQRDIRLIRDVAELEPNLHDSCMTAGVITEFVDTREGFRRKDPTSVYAWYFHKKRIHVLGNTVRTNHVYFSLDPIVGLKTSNFEVRRPDLMDLKSPIPYLRKYWKLPQCIQEDYGYWKAGTEHENLMIRATRALGLAFTAIDYSTLADGSVILWEANPYPATVSKSPLPRLRHSQGRAEGIHARLGEALLTLIPDPVTQPE